MRTGRRVTLALTATVLVAVLTVPAVAQELARGPYARMVIRGGTLIDGTGAPPIGPVDIVVEGDRIVEIAVVGDDFGRIDPGRRPAGGDLELDAEGMYVLPGLINAHVHIGSRERTGMPTRYNYYLWLGHGITTVLEAGSGNGLEWTIAQRDSAARGEIEAPRIFAYVRPGMSFDRPVRDATTARAWVREVAAIGADGLKLGAHRPDIMEALIDEAHAHGILTTAHLGQTGVTRMNVVDAARLGLDHQQHWYGLPNALLDDETLPDWPADYNQNNEYDRFSQAGRFMMQAAEPGSERWRQVMEELIALDFTIYPTFSVYEDSRDFMRVSRSEWHDEYASPGLLEYWEPDPDHHGSLYFYWRTSDEVAWYRFFIKWQRFIDEFKDRGGRVGTGADESSGYTLYGFSYIRELELLQQAGFHPLEVFRSATLHSAEGLRVEDHLGSVEEGKIADLVIVGENPLDNLKVLYGTGALKYDPELGRATRVGGVRWTIKSGVVYDAEGMRADVRRMVEAAKAGQPVSDGSG